jgi:hypothetical protein
MTEKNMSKERQSVGRFGTGTGGFTIVVVGWGTAAELLVA